MSSTQMRKYLDILNEEMYQQTGIVQLTGFNGDPRYQFQDPGEEKTKELMKEYGLTKEMLFDRYALPQFMSKFKSYSPAQLQEIGAMAAGIDAYTEEKGLREHPANAIYSSVVLALKRYKKDTK